MPNHENRKAVWERRWSWKEYGWCVLAVALVLVVTGCTTNAPLFPNKPLHPTATTLADAWKLLEQRPVRLLPLSGSTSCPLTRNQEILPYFGFTPGKGPVSVRETSEPFSTGVPTTGDTLQNEGWKGQKEIWFIRPPYLGPILVRGRLLNGPQTLRFSGGYAQLYYNGDPWEAPTSPELLLLGSTQYDYPPIGWGVYSFARVPGCYVYQVDGLDFSGYFIFQVIFGP